MELTLTWTIARRELREALRNKWLWFYALGFGVLAFGLAQAGMSAAGYAGLGGFGRTAASLINSLLLFVPLIGITVGAGVIAGERERGTLLYLLAQPVNRAEVFFGKALGAALAVIAALALGFGIAGLGLANQGGDPASFLALVGFAVLLALASLGIGFIISALTHKAATASGAAMIVWLALVFIGDLGLIGATMAFRPTPASMLTLVLVNPLQIFKLGAIYSLRSTIDTLGAAGQYAMIQFGDTLPFVLVSLLVGWTALSFALAYGVFARKGDV
ncbi:MAG: ABC transporter permease subunit [Anaerolineae bacterium]|nr:ABC transporter permease subunit [Anaerolineae bacterium]